MAKIKLTKTAVEAAQPQPCDVELRDTVVPGFLCKVTPHRGRSGAQGRRTGGEPPQVDCRRTPKSGTRTGTGGRVTGYQYFALSPPIVMTATRQSGGPTLCSGVTSTHG